MALRVFSILFATLSILASTLAAAPIDFGVRMTANDGVLTAHKNCSSEDHKLVQDAILNAVIIESPPQRRDLRSNKRRKLQSHCNNYCEGLLFNACYSYSNCQNYATINCSGGKVCTRKLRMERVMEHSTLLVLDDLFENGPSNDRKLVETFGITEEQCNEYKARLYQTVLSQLGDIATECANLVLAPARLQCIVVVPTPSPAPSIVPSGSPSQSPVV